MTTTNFQIGQEVIRTKGDYVIGRIGKIINIDSQKNRAQVEWNNDPKTWVSFSVIELTSIPYEILPSYKDKKGNWKRPKYKKII